MNGLTKIIKIIIKSLKDPNNNKKVENDYSNYLEIDELFNKITKKNDSVEIEKPLSNDIIEKVSAKSRNSLECELPLEYKEFLRKMNGFYYNGYSIYGVYSESEDFDKSNEFYDLLPKNESFRDYSDVDNFLILGKSDIDYIAYEIKTKKYVLITNGTLDVLKSSDSFTEILNEFLKYLK